MSIPSSQRTLRIVIFFAALFTMLPASVSRADRTTAYGPVRKGATITSEVWRCSSHSYHGALDIAASCGRPLRSMLHGRRRWHFSHAAANRCSGGTSGDYGNYFMYTGRNGYQFIEGHANDNGSREDNLAIAELRAKAAARFLMTMGVPDTRLWTVSYGSDRPVCTSKSDACAAKNRRVHFRMKLQ